VPQVISSVVRSHFTHLECSASCGAAPLDPRTIQHLCVCGRPLLARYDLDKARHWDRSSLRDRPPDMWRYRDLMPLFEGERAVTLGEGFTPLVHASRLGSRLGLSRLYVKDESLNPTNSFKARGLAAAVTKARTLGARVVSVPSAGNAGCAVAAYAARAGLEARVFLPRDAKPAFARECLSYGAVVTFVDGLIIDAGRVAAEQGRERGWYDLSTLREPYRIEGKKTMGYELAEQLEWRLPDWILYPTGGGTGLIGMWKAFDEMERLGWIGPARPRMVSVQAAGCAPIVRAFERGDDTAPMWEGAHTVADGLRVPRAIGDFLMLQIVRKSRGEAIAVEDAALVAGMQEIGATEGISASPESGAALVALRRLVERQTVRPDDLVVLFSTGGGLKYLDLIVGPAGTPS
jgi:threonine synthase